MSEADSPAPTAWSASSIAVVIPALDEADRLPALLDALSAQTRRADDIVVADAGSRDATARLATTRGARVVAGGKPAAGRNAGARATTADLVVFLDADDLPTPDFIATACAEFERRGLSVATAHVEPLERTPSNIFACDVVNLYLDLMQYVSPHAPGFCILVRRDTHEAIGGFDETLALAEDHEYVQRAAETGKFRVLHDVAMSTSMRRIEKEGLIRLAFKYLYSELYVVSGRPMHEVPFEYEFAAFSSADEAGDTSEDGAVREFLARAREGIREVSAESFDALERLAAYEITPQAFEARLAELTNDEIADLHRYVRRRVQVAARVPRLWVRRISGRER